MNILVLNGSPRLKGNTSALVEAFTDEAQKAGHQVSVKQIGRMDIRGCKNCDACRKTLNGDCVSHLLLFFDWADPLCDLTHLFL
ncbi:MAG: NAD(P)H-dependent oxidoreductase [Clostridium sp.]|nr:NAD(P)H-dependent oxidoreductase [Clostridium sp.]